VILGEIKTIKLKCVIPMLIGLSISLCSSL